MTTAAEHGHGSAGGAGAPALALTGEQVWRAIARASFAVVSYVTPAGEPRSSGVVYGTAGRRLYVVVAPGSWKARHIAASGRVAVTVPVRRGGLLPLLLPIPPATVSFHGTAIVHPPGEAAQVLPEQLKSLMPADRAAAGTVLEIIPEGDFVTYGVGVSLMAMRIPDAARGRVPASAPLAGQGRTS